jgi:hypothetical protein
MILAKTDEIYSNAAIYGSIVSFVKTSLNIYDLNHVNKPNTNIEEVYTEIYIYIYIYINVDLLPPVVATHP